MPLPGGATDKFGNRYEGRWTVACIAEVMDERADAIRMEPPGEEGEGVEFWLHIEGRREYHQVKRQHSASGRWTLADLGGKRVLSHFFEKLSDTKAWCVFVSTQSAFQLEELADRARRSASWEEFNREFLKADAHSGVFSELCQKWWNCSEVYAYEALKRIRVETVSENFLRTTVGTRLKTLVEGDPSTVADVLAQLALDKVHHELTADELWQHLESRDYHRRQWGKDPHVLAAVDTANNRYLSPLRDEAIAGKVIPRDETQTVLHKLTTLDGKRGVLLSGEAGVGKSSVIFQVVDLLREQGLPVLAFRVDRLEPELLPDDVGQQLGLPGSPANVLAAIAQRRDCVLVIDQLDAVSLASGRHPQFFDCVNEIIKQALAHPRTRLLLACRKFDVDNDHRLRRLTGLDGIADTVAISRLSSKTVEMVVTELGLDVERLNSKQMDLLSIPLHLKLLVEIAENLWEESALLSAFRVDSLDFKTAGDLYDCFWDYKQEVIRKRLGRSVQWTRVVDALCDYMSNRQVLSAPKAILDDYADDAKAMASEHVLVRDGKQYAFFHESFFDYAFARRFVAHGRELLPFLQSSEQHLFRRAQVRQILLHQRETDFARYLANLRALLTQPDIRFHLKQVMFALLAELTDPTSEEWNVIAPLMDGQADPYTREIWRILHRLPWFNLLDSLGLIERWLTSQEPEFVNQTIMLLSKMQNYPSLADRVAELVEPYVGTSDTWRDRLVSLTRWANLSAGRRFFELFLRLIDEGVLDEENMPIIVNELPKEHPEWGCEVISHYLNRRLALSLAAGHPNPFDDNSGTIFSSSISEEQFFMESARGAPDEFVTFVLPFMLCVMALTAKRDGEPPWSDSVWPSWSRGDGHGISGSLLSAMEVALSELAANEPETFAAIAERLRTLDFETIQYLLIRAYAANGARFADEAAAYLCQRPARLETGYLGKSHWATRQLLEAITPHCSDELLARLEGIILDYYSEWEKSADGRHRRGYAQFILLLGIAHSRCSETAFRRLEEWRRKFGIRTVEAPKPIEVEYIGSPIPEGAADKMTDEQWLRAIARYSHDDMGFKRDGRLVGGALELSRLLEGQVKKEPARFAKVVCDFPDDTNPYYFDAVLRGIADAGLSVPTVLRVCQRCHQLPTRPCGHSICEPIGKLAELPLPKEALDIVAWYATEAPDPEQELWRTESRGGDVYYGGDILTAAINSVRGRAAEAVRELIFYDGKRISHFLPTLERMVADRSIAVRACVAAALTSVLKHDRNLAVSLFQRLCETEDVLLATRYVERFLFYALQTHFEALEPILERMITSEVSEVQTVGARQACLASLVLKEARPLAQRYLSGTEAQRVGAAQVFSANLRTAGFRSFCEDALIKLFDDAYEKVRSEAAACFNGFEGEELGEYVKLVEAFVQSLAFTTNNNYLIRALEETTAKLPDVTCLVCERFIDSFGSDAGETHVDVAYTVSQLILRVYSQQSADAALKTRCLDLIDRMTQMGVYGLDKALALYDR